MTSISPDLDRPASSGEDAADPAPRVAAVVYALGAMVIRRIPRRLSLTALSTMATLDRTGARRITDLAAVQGVSQPSMTSVVNGLVRDGFVTRTGDPADRRVALVTLTPVGEEVLRERRREGIDSVAELVDHLADEDLHALARVAPVLERLMQLDHDQREP